MCIRDRRLVGDEYAPWAGIKPEDAAEIARRLAEDGLLDFISVTTVSYTHLDVYKRQGQDEQQRVVGAVVDHVGHKSVCSLVASWLRPLAEARRGSL